MFYYIVAVIILIAILMYFFLEFVHLPSKTFKKYSKLFILIFLIILVVYLMKFFPAIISTIPAIFLILYRWGNILKFIATIFLKKDFSKSKNSSMTKKEAYQILGLEEGLQKRDFGQLSKFNEKKPSRFRWV